MAFFRVTLAYDGAGFVGWQRQASGDSLQGLLELALSELDQRPVPVVGAGRTDAGVHALGQVASFSLHRIIDGPKLVRALNARLPPAIRILDAAEVPAGFHARFLARTKTYRYRLWNTGVLNPFERAYAWHVPAPGLDVVAMAAAASLVEGRHDFASFQSVGTSVRSTERVVFSSRIVTASDAGATATGDASGRAALITYQVRGDGFLHHMVRTIVGTLVEIGRGKCGPAWMSEVIAARDRAAAGPTAPPQGLFLVGVEYDAQL
ncbi:MAG: tRNA pseudouridine(38-40) synthase TruA [Luteitalea sp.]|nr:tRNA pseudouridine(38-40) synthase TruA [Luteitalea sp.]